MIQRAKQANPAARCCWVCGKLGGAGFTTALRLAGYDVPQGTMAYAHPGCAALAQRRAAKRAAKQQSLQDSRE